MRRPLFWFTLVAFLFGLVGCRSATRARPEEEITRPERAPVSGARDHGSGYFQRWTLGGGYGVTSGPGAQRMSGSDADMSLAIGGVVKRNTALHGTIQAWHMPNPSVEAGGHLLEASAVTLLAVGVGLTHYFTPRNLYLSGSVGPGATVFWGGPFSGGGGSDFGPVFEIALGREWWTSDHWGCGVALGLVYHSLSDPNDDEGWEGLSVSLRLSATRN